MKKILILCYSQLHRDPRVHREIIALKDDYELTVAGLSRPEIEGNYRFIKIDYPRPWWWILSGAIKLKLHLFESFYWSGFHIKDTWSKLRSNKYDLILTNDMNTLPVAVRLAQESKAKLYLDAHEYEPKHFNDKWWFRFLMQDYWNYICKKYLPNVDTMTTVCEGIAQEYFTNFGIKCEIVTNAPFYENLKPTENSDKIKMIHHGGVNRSRRMEFMIELMDHLDDRFNLDFMLIENDRKYLNYLKKLATKNPRIKFRNPVSMNEISKVINDYDIGLYMLKPNAFNYEMILPNKFFEFIQARLAIFIWPSSQMKIIVEKFNVGFVTKEFSVEEMAKKLNSLTRKDINDYKKNSSKAAKILCAEENEKIIKRLVSGLLES